MNQPTKAMTPAEAGALISRAEDAKDWLHEYGPDGIITVINDLLTLVREQAQELDAVVSESEKFFGFMQNLFGFDEIGDDPTDVFIIAKELFNRLLERAEVAEAQLQQRTEERDTALKSEAAIDLLISQRQAAESSLHTLRAALETLEQEMRAKLITAEQRWISSLYPTLKKMQVGWADQIAAIRTERQ